MRRFSIKSRLAAGYIGVLLAAMLTLAVGAWWLFHSSMLRAADAALVARIEGTERFIDATEHELPPERVEDEFHEFADLTSGETLLEVTDDRGRVLCRPSVAGWSSTSWPASPRGTLLASDHLIAAQPYRVMVTGLEVAGHRYRLAAAIPMSTEYGAPARLQWLLAGLALSVMVIAGVGGFWLSARALAPVDRITRDVRQISLRHLERRVDVPPADDEIRRLAVTFNELLARLQGPFDDMVRFTADASHELRTPVSLARTTAELSLARPRTTHEYRHAMADILAQTERMSQLVEDLLVLARSDAGMESPDREPLDLRTPIDDALVDVGPRAALRNLRLDRILPPSHVVVQGSSESLRRLLVIVLDNAIKYSGVGGTVTVRLTTTETEASVANGSARIEVIDSGPGVPDNERPRVFDRFYRGVVARAMVPDGHGLGLSIAQRIVARHEGTIAVEDGYRGVGCRVVVTMPL